MSAYRSLATMRLGAQVQPRQGLFPHARLGARMVLWRHAKARRGRWRSSQGVEPATVGKRVRQGEAAPLPTAEESPPAQRPAAAAATGTYLREIYIKDFALVAEQRVQLEPGLNVVTGESGSGKSVLVEALGQILGAPAPDEAVREPAEGALLEGRVELAPQERAPLAALLGALGLPRRALPAGDTLLLRRELLKGTDGVRSRCFLNGCPTSVRVLREVGRLLVDVNGQHAALALKDSFRQLALLDRVAGTAQAAQSLAGTLGSLGEARAQVAALAELGDEGEREEMQRLVDQVHAAGVEPGEEQQLRKKLRHMESRRAAAERCRLVTVGLGAGGGAEGEGVQEAIRSVEGHVRAVLRQEEALAATAHADHEREGDGGDGTENGAGHSPQEAGGAEGLLQRTLELLGQARDLLEEAEDEMARYARQYRFSQVDYDETYSRLQQLERLMKQYDVASADELLDLAAAKGAALDRYFQLEGQAEQLQARAQQLEAQAQQECVQLSVLRREAAGKLRAVVESVLRDLAMGESRFDVRVAWMPVGGSGEEGSRSGARRGAAGASISGSGSGRVTSLFINEEQAQRCWEAGGQAYKLRPSGLDSVEFMFAAGPAEPLRPLSAVASGGESARIMLALKAAPTLVGVLGQQQSGADEAPSINGAAEESSLAAGGDSSGSSPIMILDEVDSGVGSRLGQPVGRILRSMVQQQGSGPATSQILCVSHLPQVAAHAQHHICVRKSVDEGERMVTCFDSLRDPEARLQEVSAMLGLPLTAAQELMAAAQEECVH